jgi:hypothetical protein
MELAINLWAVLACAVLGIVLGTLWYGPVFGKLWMKETGITPEAAAAFRADPKKMRGMMAKSYGLTIVSSFIMAFVLAHVFAFASAFTGMSGVMGGLSAGFWSWLGFVLPVSLNPVLWDGKSWKYFFITSGYYLAILLVMGVVLGAWQ